MNVTTETVDHISALARLRPAEGEKQQTAAELESILTYMELLHQLPADDAEPLCHTLPAKNVLREDTAAPSLPRAELLSNAPSSDGAFILVPQTVEQRHGAV